LVADNIIFSKTEFIVYSIFGKRMNVDLRTLELFCAVAEELSITLSAQRLGRAPSNVTTRIQQLEKELDVSLFLRHSNRLHLSPEGDQFLAYAKKILAIAEEARQVLHPNTPAGSLRIGSMESTAASRLPPVLAEYHRHWPDVKIELTTGPSRPMLESLQARMVDCAFVAPLFGTGEDTSSVLSSMGLAGQPVFKEELMLILPEGHPPVVSASDVSVSSLVAFRQGCTYRAIAENWFREAVDNESAFSNVQEVGSYHAMIACVSAGTSASVIPRSVLGLLNQPPQIQQIPLTVIHTWSVWREGYETPALKELLKVLSGSSSPEGL